MPLRQSSVVAMNIFKTPPVNTRNEMLATKVHGSKRAVGYLNDKNAGDRLHAKMV